MGNGSNTCDSESLLASCAVPGTVVEDQPDLLLTCYYDEKENTLFLLWTPGRVGFISPVTLMNTLGY